MILASKNFPLHNFTQRKPVTTKNMASGHHSLYSFASVIIHIGHPVCTRSTTMKTSSIIAGTRLLISKYILCLIRSEPKIAHDAVDIFYNFLHEKMYKTAQETTKLKFFSLAGPYVNIDILAQILILYYGCDAFKMKSWFSFSKRCRKTWVKSHLLSIPFIICLCIFSLLEKKCPHTTQLFSSKFQWIENSNSKTGLIPDKNILKNPYKIRNFSDSE